MSRSNSFDDLRRRTFRHDRMNHKVVIITGGIGSGKSTLCAFLRSKGYPVYDSDSAAKALQKSHPELQAMVTPDIFLRTDALKALENAVYPLLMEDFRLWASRQESELLFFESAIVLQKEFFDKFGDYVILVDADVEHRLERTACRKGGEEEIRRRMALQRDERSNPRVDFIIDNNGSVSDAEKELEKVINKLKN